MLSLYCSVLTGLSPYVVVILLFTMQEPHFTVSILNDCLNLIIYYSFVHHIYKNLTKLSLFGLVIT